MAVKPRSFIIPKIRRNVKGFFGGLDKRFVIRYGREHLIKEELRKEKENGESRKVSVGVGAGSCFYRQHRLFGCF